MLRIYLARHGQDEDNANGLLNGHRDTPLTEVGRGQAEALANDIKRCRLKFAAIYTSPLGRSTATAQMIADAIGGPVPVVLPNLIERDFGVMAGKPIADVQGLSPEDVLYANPVTYFLRSEGGETFPQAIVRAQKVLDHVQARHMDGDVLLITHGDIGKMIYAAYYRLKWRDVLANFHLGNADLLVMAESSSPEETHVFEADQFNI